MHQTQGVPHRLGAQHALTRDWADTAVSQGGCHDTGALAGHLEGAQLEDHTKDNFYHFSIQLSTACLTEFTSNGSTAVREQESRNEKVKSDIRKVKMSTAVVQHQMRISLPSA